MRKVKTLETSLDGEFSPRGPTESRAEMEERHHVSWAKTPEASPQSTPGNFDPPEILALDRPGLPRPHFGNWTQQLDKNRSRSADFTSGMWKSVSQGSLMGTSGQSLGLSTVYPNSPLQTTPWDPQKEMRFSLQPASANHMFLPRSASGSWGSGSAEEISPLIDHRRSPDLEEVETGWDLKHGRERDPVPKLMSSLRSVPSMGSIANACPTPLLEAAEASTKSASSWSTFVNCLNSFIGASIVIPYAFQQCGWSAVIVLFFQVVISTHTAHLLGWMMSHHPSCQVYSDLGGLLMGRSGVVAIGCLLLLGVVLTLIQLLILGGDNVEALLFNLLSTHKVDWGHPGLIDRVMENSKLISYFVIILMALPTAFLRDFSSFRWLSTVGIASMVALTFTVLALGLKTTTGVGLVGFVPPNLDGNAISPQERNGPFGTTAFFPKSWQSLVVTYGLLMGGVSTHTLFPSFYWTMKEPRRYFQVMDASFAFGFCLFCLVGGSAYASLGDHTPVEINMAFPTDPPLKGFLSAGMVLVVLTKFGMFANALALPLEDLLHNARNGEPLAPMHRVVLRGSLVLLCFVMAISCPRFEAVSAFQGTFIATIVSVTIPTGLFAKLKRDLSRDQSGSTASDYDEFEMPSELGLTSDQFLPPTLRRVSWKFYAWASLFSLCFAVVTTMSTFSSFGSPVPARREFNHIHHPISQVEMKI